MIKLIKELFKKTEVECVRYNTFKGQCDCCGARYKAFREKINKHDICNDGDLIYIRCRNCGNDVSLDPYH